MKEEMKRLPSITGGRHGNSERKEGKADHVTGRCKGKVSRSNPPDKLMRSVPFYFPSSTPSIPSSIFYFY